MRKSRITRTALIALVGFAGAPAAGAGAEVIDSKPLRDAVKVKGIRAHQKALQGAADRGDGIRASGTPGYGYAADYVARTMKAAGYTVKRQKFAFPFFQETATPVFSRVSPEPRAFAEGTDFSTMEFSGAGDVQAPVQAVDVTVPPAAEPSSTSGCEASDFNGFALGNIALVQRGTCDFAVKAANAARAGASAIVIFNEGQEGRTDADGGTLGGPQDLPALFASFAVGQELVGRLRAGQAVTLKITIETISERRTTENVIADSRRGDPDDVVVVGAHIDSITDGAGGNDNGSGAATALEIAENLGAVRPAVRKRVRFAFWGAEENGLLGAAAYVQRLSESQKNKIGANLNFDMLGSRNYVRYVYDGDGSGGENDPGPDGSTFIEKLFLDYYESIGLATTPTPFDGRSDYDPFITAGIPAGGLFSGAEEVKTPAQAEVYGGTAGEQLDPCYHEACDSSGNVSPKALDELGDGAAHATYVLARMKAAITDEAVVTLPKGKSSRAARTVAPGPRGAPRDRAARYRGSRLVG